MSQDLIVKLNNDGCNLLDQGDASAAMSCFRSVLSNFRVALGEEVARRRRSDEKNLHEDTNFGVVDFDQKENNTFLPLSLPHYRAVQYSLVASWSSRKASIVKDERSGCSIHTGAFRMLQDLRFSSDHVTNVRIYMAIAIFNLSLSLHLLGRHGNNDNCELHQAGALYGLARRLFQDSMPRSQQRSGNSYVDFLYMAILNNSVILHCYDLSDYDTSELLVNNFEDFAQAVQQDRATTELGEREMQSFFRNAAILRLFFPKAAAAAA
jgi:hypothetical protein